MIPARGPQTVFGQCYIKYICGNLKFANRLKLRSKDALEAPRLNILAKQK